jgi:tetratricopeptide (TPR) repeat protein
VDPANLEKAKQLYLEVLRQNADRPIQAAANYGLARIAALQNDPETSQALFQKTLELGPDPQTQAWTLVYLGRLALAASDPAEAAKDFEEALKVDGASEAARQAAAEGLQNHPRN